MRRLADLLLAVQALHVPIEQDLHTVPRPYRDLSRIHSGVATGGEGRVPQVVRAPCEGRGDGGWRQGEDPRLLPGPVDEDITSPPSL